ncbi:MAG: hypothetical protein GY928_26075 [Colwellia sp.]|nr:hypothetical protein [Colwellia sp.]
MCFESKSLLERESRYGATELEGLALVFALNRFHHHVYLSDIIIITDHSPLKSLLNKENLSDRLYRWAMFISQYRIS